MIDLSAKGLDLSVVAIMYGKGSDPFLCAPKVDAWALYDNAGTAPVLLDWSEKP
ncbi:MAG: hypothetical protein Q8R95_03180 [Azonexus sp.]|nr:hypothetical protein [Azonexus sp.]